MCICSRHIACNFVSKSRAKVGDFVFCLESGEPRSVSSPNVLPLPKFVDCTARQFLRVLFSPAGSSGERIRCFRRRGLSASTNGVHTHRSASRFLVVARAE